MKLDKDKVLILNKNVTGKEEDNLDEQMMQLAVQATELLPIE